MKKLIVTMCMDNWEPEITNLTFPLMRFHARKIGADFVLIDQRRWSHLPLQYERFQIYDLAKDYDWVIQLDADLLMHPDMPDLTNYVGKDTVLTSMWDSAPKRFQLDQYFLRDGRFISVPGFFTVTSNWCRDFWDPNQDIDIIEHMNRVTPCVHEWQGRKVDNSHIVLDYLLSRNVAKFGLRLLSFQDLFKRINENTQARLGVIEDYICHNSYLPLHHKRQHLKNVVYHHWKLQPGVAPLI